MTKKYFNSFRAKSELYETDLIRDYFNEFKERQFMLINIQTFNGFSIPAYISRAEHRENILKFPIYSVETNRPIPNDVFIRFIIQNKDNKIVEIPFIEEPKIIKYGKKTQYELSEYLTTEELLNKEFYDTFVMDDKVCLLADIKYRNGIYEYVFFDVVKGTTFVVNSSSINQSNIVKSLTNKKAVNKQQYVMALCNILLVRYEKERYAEDFKWMFAKIINRNNLDGYDDYFTDLMNANNIR